MLYIASLILDILLSFETYGSIYGILNILHSFKEYTKKYLEYNDYRNDYKNKYNKIKLNNF
jgi:hypothetical protein